MGLTNFDFLNKIWSRVQDSEWFNSESTNEEEKEDAKSCIIELGKSIDVVLRKEIRTHDWNEFIKWHFDQTWSVLGYDKKFENYKKVFIDRMQHSLDVDKIIDIAIKENEIVNLKYDEVIYQQDRIKRGHKLGYALAVNGENPAVVDILFNLRYYFDSGYYYCQHDENIDDRIYCEITHTSFDQKFTALHEVCEGYLRAKFFYFLKGIKKEEQNTIDAPNPLPNKAPKLKWLLQKNQLYAIIRQLKNDHEAIGNSYNELADFIVQNVVGFENTAKETVEKELKRDKPLPKNKRINLDLNQDE